MTITLGPNQYGKAEVRLVTVQRTGGWTRILVDGKPHEHAFASAGNEKRTTAVTIQDDKAWVVSGLSEEVDALAPAEVSPTPAHMIRILMDATPVKACPTELTPPVWPDAAPAREGFTVVEWGGVLREGR
jgi:hypothetical protein